VTSPTEAGGRSSIPGRPLLWLLPAVALATVAAVAWAMPTEANVNELRPVTTEFSFDYGAPLPDNVVYDAPTLQFGDVVFMSVVGAVDVEVGWRVPAPDALVSSGTLTVSVVLESGAGWQRTLAAPPPRRFSDRGAAMSVDVDFAAARDLATQIDDVVGATGPMVVRVIARADVVGAVARPGQMPVPLERVTTAELVFDLTSGTATMRDPGTAGTAVKPTAPSSDGVTVAETSSATGPRPTSAGVQSVVQMTPTAVTVPNQMSFAVADVDVRIVRYGATALASLCAFMGVSGLVISRRAKRRGEAAYIAARYGSRLVPLRSMPDVRSSAPFELTSFDALLAVATQLGLPVMVDESGPSTSYYVADALSTFVYTASGTSRSRADERRERKRQRVLERVEARERKEQAKRDKQRARWAADDAELQARRERERAEWQRIDAELQLQRDAVIDPTTPQG
jgi:hypothetical protein